MRKRSAEHTAMLRKAVVMVAEIVIIAAILFLAVAVIGGITTGNAESEYSEAYVICQPGDYVNVRIKPMTRSRSVGRYETGDRVTTDGKEKNGFIHIVSASLETSEAWISAGYIVYEEPERIDRKATVTSRARLAARKTIGGKVRKWLKTGDTVTVYWFTDEWCATNKGFIKTQYLDLDGE